MNQGNMPRGAARGRVAIPQQGRGARVPQSQQYRQQAGYAGTVPAGVGVSTPEQEQRDVDAALASNGYTQVFSPQDIQARLQQQTGRVAGQVGGARRAQQQPQQAGTPVVEFRDVHYTYPEASEETLHGVSFKLMPGSFTFLLSSSGGGKSTTMKLMNRTLKATSGQVLINGQDIHDLSENKVSLLRQQIGTVFQDYKLLPNKTVYQNVALALRCISKPQAVIDAQVPEVLKLVGLGDKMDSYPTQLSGGEQQRVSIARAMVNRPPLLICDEPTGNLDPAISLGIMRILARINMTGTTLLVSTHDLTMVDRMKQHVLELTGGVIVRDEEGGAFYGNE